MTSVFRYLDNEVFKLFDVAAKVEVFTAKGEWILCDKDIYRIDLLRNNVRMKIPLNIHENHLKNLEYYQSAVFGENNILMTGTKFFSKLVVYQYDDDEKDFVFRKCNFLIC